MASFDAKFHDISKFNASFKESGGMNASFGNVQVVETGDYNALKNKPKIEGRTLIDDNTLPQIGVGTATIAEIEKILYLD